MTIAKSQEVGCTITLSQDVRGNVRYGVSATDAMVEAALDTLQKALTGARAVIANNGFTEAHESEEDAPTKSNSKKAADRRQKDIPPAGVDWQGRKVYMADTLNDEVF